MCVWFGQELVAQGELGYQCKPAKYINISKSSGKELFVRTGLLGSVWCCTGTRLHRGQVGVECIFYKHLINISHTRTFSAADDLK